VAEEARSPRDAVTDTADANAPGGLSPTRLFLIRHGETTWNVEGRYQGQADPPLNDQGLRQARSLARRLRRRGLAVLYTSPLLRASATTEILAGILSVPVHVDARLMEINLGRWQGRLATDIAREDPALFRRWHSEPWDVLPPGGESLTQVRNRVFAAADEILAGHRGQCVGIVSHRIPCLLLGMRYLGFPADAIGAFKIANASFEEIVVTDAGARAAPAQPNANRRGSATTGENIL
jgi:broad specificity phosphatase PhoE